MSHTSAISLILLRLLWTLAFLCASLALYTLIRQWRQTRTTIRMQRRTSIVSHTRTHACDHLRIVLHDIRTHPPLMIALASLLKQVCFITLVLCKWIAPSQQRIGYEMLPTLLFVGGLQFYVVGE